MIQLTFTNTNEPAGMITDEQLQFLVDQLEEEYLEDQDYAFTGMTLDYLEEQGASAELLETLRSALGAQEEVILRWAKV
jgi:processive 1,2-diacylglycerol beta-glucosyltransferase